MSKVMPPWLFAVLVVLWGAATAVVESGLVAEGSAIYTIAGVVSAALAGVVGAKAAIKRKREQKLYLNHRTDDLRTKPPKLRL